MNGLLRDYFPKRTDLRTHTAKRPAAIVVEINTRPGKPWLGHARRPVRRPPRRMQIA
jgi:IS30 family transposase